MRLVLILTVIFGLVGCKQDESNEWQVKDGVGVRFHMPTCHRKPDGLVECTMKKLSEEERR